MFCNPHYIALGLRLVSSRFEELAVAPMENVTIFTAFVAGLISFLSPCVLLLVPGYVEQHAVGNALVGASSEGLPEILEQQQQLERVCRRRLEFEVLVEPASRFIYGMNHDRPNRNNVRSLFNSCQSIEEKRFAEPLSVLGPIHCQSGEEDNTDGVAGQTFGNAVRALVFVNGAGR